jgi:hypothetical protein
MEGLTGIVLSFNQPEQTFWALVVEEWDSKACLLDSLSSLILIRIQVQTQTRGTITLLL